MRKVKDQCLTFEQVQLYGDLFSIYELNTSKGNNKQPMEYDAQLATTCLFTPIFSAGDFDLKVGHTDLVFGV